MPQTKTRKTKYFLPFNFAITKICVMIRLVEDGARMDVLYFQLSHSNKYATRQIHC